MSTTVFCQYFFSTNKKNIQNPFVMRKEMAIWGHISLNVCMLSLAKRNKSDPSPRKESFHWSCDAVLFHMSHLSNLLILLFNCLCLFQICFKKQPLSQIEPYSTDRYVGSVGHLFSSCYSVIYTCFLFMLHPECLYYCPLEVHR